VVTGIARLSDLAVTNIQLYRNRLEQFDPSKRGKIVMLAIPSSVGEPWAPDSLSARAKSMVIFGLPPSRRRSYETRLRALESACEQLGIAEVHDVGPAFDGVPERIGDVPVRKHGHLSADQLSPLLSQSMTGFVDYSPGYMAKSAVFAAYCAHRMLPVLPQDGCSESDGIRCGVHYYNVGGAAASGASAPPPQAIADAAWRWYHGHSLRSHARAFAAAVARREDMKRAACR
jgi:hypothetical protein